MPTLIKSLAGLIVALNAYAATLPADLDPPIPTLIEHYAKEYQVSAEIASKIAWCESGLKQEYGGQPLRGRINPKDVGVFQINEVYHLETARKLGFDIYLAEGNVQYAMWLMSREGTRPWRLSEKCWAMV